MKQLFLLSILVTFVSCASSTIYVSKSDETTVVTKGSSQEHPVVKTTDVRTKIVAKARSYSGVKYHFGGTSSKGFDCSGLMYNSYLQAAGIKIPRSSNDQYKKAAATSNPQPGDLVFFKMSSWFKIDHVGMYVGNNRMVHASPRYGVIEVSLEKEYYQERMVGFGRLLDE